MKADGSIMEKKERTRKGLEPQNGEACDAFDSQGRSIYGTYVYECRDQSIIYARCHTLMPRVIVVLDN